MIRLSELKIGDKGFVLSIEDETLEQQLFQMGVTPGEMIQVERVSPLSDPIAILVSNSLLSIRLSDARNIIISLYNE